MARSRESQFRVAGVSLLELAIGLIILVILVSAFGTALASSVLVTGEVTSSVELDNGIRRLHQRIVTEMRFVDRDSIELADPDGSPAVSFRTVEGWDGSAPVLGPVHVLEFADGALSLDGRVLGSGFEDVSFRLQGSVLSVSAAMVHRRHSGGTTEMRRSLTSPINP